VWGLIGGRIVWASRIESEYIWLKGVSAELLAQLPEWNAR